MSSMFIFAHGDVHYGIPVMEVLEIVEMPELLPAHGAMPGCLGNTSHRGYLMPILDPTALVSERSCARSKRFVIVNAGQAFFGLAMDAFVSVAAIPVETELDDPRRSGPFVDRARAYAGNALLLLAVDAITRLVMQHFVQQEFASTAGEHDIRKAGGSVAASEIFLCARLEEVRFAIPIGYVTEIVEGSDLTPLFKMPPLIRGLINVRGQVLACLDISVDLLLQPRDLGERSQFVILKFEDAELALCVDRVTGIRQLAPGRLQNSDMVLAGDLHRLAIGMHEEADGTLLILSVAGVFDAPALVGFRGGDA